MWKGEKILEKISVLMESWTIVGWLQLIGRSQLNFQHSSSEGRILTPQGPIP